MPAKRKAVLISEADCVSSQETKRKGGVRAKAVGRTASRRPVKVKKKPEHNAASEERCGPIKRRRLAAPASEATPRAEAAQTAGSLGTAAAALTRALTEPSWSAALAAEFEQTYFEEIARFVHEERSQHTVHPPAEQVFAALNETPLDKVKVVILGQDPYHEPGQAHGMCFSVLPGVRAPASLKNIYKELADDIPGFEVPSHGYLMHWAKQGVLLLNATLTVREGHTQANSHSKCGWQTFTDKIIEAVNARADGVVFLLWGGFAQKKGKIIDTERHRVVECAHPSPLSVKKWRGCKVFSRCNSELQSMGSAPIDWRLPENVV